MQPGWHSAGRSSGWRRSCARSDGACIPAGLSSAFADRTAIDWSAALARARDSRGRAAVERLRHLDRLRGAGEPQGLAAAPPLGLPLPFRVLLALALLQVWLALAGAALGALEGRLPARVLPQAALTVAFGGGALLLSAASPRERRGPLLLGVLLLAACAFSRALVQAAPAPVPRLAHAAFTGIYPEALTPALLWRFAAAFPDVRRFAPFDRFTRRAEMAALALGGLLAAANIALAHGVPGSEIAASLARDHPGNLFWHLFALAALPAVAAVLARAPRAASGERRKAVRFAAAIGAGTAPLLSTGLLRLAVPPVNDWMLAASDTERLLVDVPILAGLAAMPVLATFAVIADGPLDARAIVPGWMRARAAVLGLAPAAGRPRRPLRRAGYADRLAAALDRVRRARGTRELIERLRGELRAALGVRLVAIAGPSSLPADAALVRLFEDGSGPLDVSRDGPLFRLLPRLDREWLAARDAALAAAITRNDGSVAAIVLVGSRPGGAPLRRGDRGFLSALLAGAASRWESLCPPAAAGMVAAEPAFECPACGVVAGAAPLPCRCGREPVVAALPALLSGKFLIARRLGAGGMGVVYLARDAALGREVAVKTLAALERRLAAQIQAEARAMAALNHESLATIYGLESWRGTPVLVVEYFARGTLADRMAGGSMAPGAVLDLGVRLCGGLAYMHHRGMVHGDVKPANIGISETGAPKLLDFGLAAVRDGFGGTPEYLPPEVLDGTPSGPAADLWGLATVLLDACGGLAAAPAPLADFFARALAPAAGDRFQSSEEMKAALEAAAAALGAPSLARADITRERAAGMPRDAGGP